MPRFIGVGHVPTFLVRVLAMPVVSSCTTLAVMRAVPGKQSGLASGAGASRLLIEAVIPRGFH